MARYDIAGLQYEDNAGNPLIGGKLYFYDSGTTTSKVTFSDIDETTANANPVVLDASGRAGDIYFSGSAKIIIKDSSDVTISEKDPVTASGSAGGRLSFSVWNALSTYSTSDLVTASNSKYYRCIVASSQGQEPSATAASWTEVRFLGQWNTNQTYAIDDISQGSDGSLYTALVAQAGNDPISDPVNWRETAISSLVKDTTPQLGGPLSTNSHQIQWSKGADVASAAELAVLTDGNYFDVTGTVSITSFIDLPIGTVVKLHFDAILTLTNNADIVCLSGANIATAAGDEAEFVYFDTGKVRMTAYERSDGTSLVSAAGGAWTYLSTVTASGAGTVDIETTIDSTYDVYMITAVDVWPSTTGGQNLICHLKQGSYGTWTKDFGVDDVTSPTFIRGTASIVAKNTSVETGQYGAFTAMIYNPAGSSAKIATFTGGFFSGHATQTHVVVNASFMETTTTAVTGIRFLMASGNINGTFKLYGLNKT